MPTWEEIKSGIRSVTNKVIQETDAFAEETSLAIKKKKAEANLASAYEKLGKIAYQLTHKADAELRTNQAFLVASKEVDHRRAELNEIEAMIRKAKEAKQEAHDSEEKATE